MRFYNRERELELLGGIGKDFRIAVLGRRRVGKTRLVEHFYQKRCLTFFIPAEKAEKETISNWADEYPSLSLPRVSTFKELFEFVFSHFKDKVIFLDEIQNVLKVNKSFIYDLQRLIDKHKPKLVVSGSLISLMKKVAEEYKSPLYGRFDFVLNLKELSFPTVYKIGKDLDLEPVDIFRLYSVLGGIPKYYELIEKLKAFEFDKFVLDMFIRYPQPLYGEIRTMLKEEFGKEYKTFFSILSSISQGKNRLSDIAGFLGREPSEITKYLSLLRKDFEIIERKTPLWGGKRGIYTIKNNIFSFWFSLVWKYTDLLETGDEEEAAKIVERNLNKYVSLMFEKTILELLKGGIVPLPSEFTAMGRQWGRIQDAPKGENQYEIDIVAINRETKSILFSECKWKEGVNAEKILQELGKKAEFVKWHNGKREESFAVFAKSFSKKIEEWQGKKVYCFDLKDLGDFLR